MDVSGVESVADPKHAEAVVNKNLVDKDRTVRTPSEDSNESTISRCASQKKSRHAGRTQHEEAAWDLDRPDLQCSEGQNSRATSKPTGKDHSKTIRMAEYAGDASKTESNSRVQV